MFKKSDGLYSMTAVGLLFMLLFPMVGSGWGQPYQEQAAFADHHGQLRSMPEESSGDIIQFHADGVHSVANTDTVVFWPQWVAGVAVFVSLLLLAAILSLVRLRQRLQHEVAVRRRAEAAVRQSVQRLSMVIDHAADMIFFYDMQGRFKMVNQSACDQLGYTKEALLQLGITDLATQLEAPGHLFHFCEGIQDEDSAIVKTQFRNRNTEIIPVEMNLKRFQYRNEPWVLAVVRDVGRRTEAEAQIRSSHKMEALGSLSGGIAHDFNNILGIILGSAELAMDDVPPSNPARGCLEEIKTATRRARDIVRQILAYTRKAVEEGAPIDLAASVEASLKLVRATVPATIGIKTNFPDDEIVVLANTTQISQVVVNLCANAAHAMRQSGGTLTIGLNRCVPGDSMLHAYPEVPAGTCAILSVRDTGQGIAPEVMDRIFDPYYTTKKGGQGTGMGLAVVHGTVKMMGGYIYPRSTSGQGTQMVILLPVVAADEKPLPSDTIRIPRGSERVLFVDDEPAMVRYCTRLLERLGYGVRAYTDPMEALASFRSQPDNFDLVITDMTMPGLTGDKLALEMMKVRTDIPVVLCTGHSEWLDEKAALDIGIKAFHMKPFDRMELAATIRIVLDGEGRFHGASDRYTGQSGLS